MSRVQFKLNLKRMKEELKEFDTKFERAIKGVVQYTSTEGMGYMKEHAPWTDRTTAARNGLHTVPEHSEDRHQITFSHTVPYGIWLEIANSGRYEIIMPTVKHEGKQMMKRFQSIFDKMQRREEG